MEEQDLALHLRPPPPGIRKPVSGNQDIVGVLVAEHLHTAQLRLNHDRMDAVGHEVLNSLRPGQRLSRGSAEPDIVTKAGDGATSLFTTERPSFRLFLMDRLNSCTAEDTCLAYLQPRWFWEREPPGSDLCESLVHRVSCCLALTDGEAKSFPDHFLGAPCPALVEAWVGHGNREVVAG